MDRRILEYKAQIRRFLRALAIALFTGMILRAIPGYPPGWPELLGLALGGLGWRHPGWAWAAFWIVTLPLAYSRMPGFGWLYGLYGLVGIGLGPAAWPVAMAVGLLLGVLRTPSGLVLVPLVAGLSGGRRAAWISLWAGLGLLLYGALGGVAVPGLLERAQGASLFRRVERPAASLTELLSPPARRAASGSAVIDRLEALLAEAARRPELPGRLAVWALAAGVAAWILQRRSPPGWRQAGLAAAAGAAIELLGQAGLSLVFSGKADLSLLPSIVLSIPIATLLFPLISGWAEGTGEARERIPVRSTSEGEGALPASMFRREIPPDTWEDLGGISGIREEIEEAIRSQFDPATRQMMARMGIRPIRGVLLYGPPGTGKTRLARVIAHEARAHFIAVSGTEFTSKWFGESEANLRRIFEEARNLRPCVLFFDELEAFLPKRTELSRADAPEKGIVATFLSYTDGLGDLEGVLLVGATNHPEMIDPAALRPGRFDRLIYIGPPDRQGRLEILQRYLRGKPLAPDVDLEALAARTERFTGADLEALCMEAARRAMRRGGGRPVPITSEDFEEVLRGMRPSVTFQMLREYQRIAERYQRRVGPVEIQVERPENLPTWEDVAGLEEAKEALREAVEWPLTRPDLMQAYGIRPIRGVLLFGPPGCGKTLLARAVAGQARAHFIAVHGPELLRPELGRSEQNLQELFDRARESAPCILFFDEIDAIAGIRSSAEGTIARMVTRLLTEMDGLEPLRGVVVLAATNRPDALDPALLRPGRFDRVVYVPPPDLPARQALFRRYLQGKPVAADVDVEELARRTEGYSAADIEAICNAAARRAARQSMREGRMVFITKAMLEEILRETPPSLTSEMITFYETLRRQFER